ncbi:hypothetical protein CSUB_C0228 [Candidatus Caldarchaeum subterraneum]|uniref:EfeO-type cupredoxin-like domain-containing protein n=1 Tax=Caldiarchaeum subterraneum TaxID=311458 RepID=E6N4M6_CALS0|nr:hypothetical protein HGMM_F15E11C19 [Candidatus Caldarchaeum subterraneum]BAJ50089.1 hypothetical protein CSUB_C0228 [Candidatus Caldarchaeum subterraneum]
MGFARILMLVAAAAVTATALFTIFFMVEQSEAGEKTTTVYMYEYYFSPDEITVGRNVKVLIVFVNNGTYPHNAYLSQEKKDLAPVLYPGDSASVELFFRERGVFEVLCTVSYPAPVSHYELGMRAKIVVR